MREGKAEQSRREGSGGREQGVWESWRKGERRGKNEAGELGRERQGIVNTNNSCNWIDYIYDSLVKF